MNHPLDNPIWNALSTKLQRFDEGNDKIKIFPKEVSPFVAKEWSNDLSKEEWDELYEFLPNERSFSMVFSDKINLPSQLFDVQLSIPLAQLTCQVPVKITNLSPEILQSVDIRPLTPIDVPQMLSLTDLTKPGPFLTRTIEYGNYVGIFDKSTQDLIAMLGYRLQVPGYCEVSAICTHPNHLGKGYASYLISDACQKIQNEGLIPFLHCKIDNIRAIEVYKKMGFNIRREVSYQIFKKK